MGRLSKVENLKSDSFMVKNTNDTTYNRIRWKNQPNSHLLSVHSKLTLLIDLFTVLRFTVLRFIEDHFLFFLSALDCGTDMFELDVQLTADGQVRFIQDWIFVNYFFSNLNVFLPVLVAQEAKAFQETSQSSKMEFFLRK